MEIIEKLKERGFDAQFFGTAAEASLAAVKLIGSGSAGFGGSVTVEALGIYETLREKGNEVHWHWREEDKRRAHDQAAVSRYYLCSANALTESGQIVNVDGTGNRVAATLFGPENVVMIIGRNKLVKDLDAAYERIRTIASPMNARRLGLKTPCAAGCCTDCHSPYRMCSATVIIDRRPKAIKNFYIFFVYEDLGY